MTPCLREQGVEGDGGVDVVVGQVELDQGRIVPALGRLLGVLRELLVLGDPVDVAGEAHGVHLQPVEDGGPLAQHPVGVLVPAHEALGRFQQVGALHLDGRHRPGPRAVRTVQPPWGLREMSLIACTGCSSSTVQSQPSSRSWATRAVVPTLRAVAYSERLASPMMMCRRRKRPPARGSSRRLRMGRPAEADAVGDVDRDEGGALGELEGGHRDGGAAAGEGGEGGRAAERRCRRRAPAGGPGRSCPAPAKSCRVTRKGRSPCTMSRLRGLTRRQ